MMNQIAQLRLSAQHITQADFIKPETVVKHLLALQAQDYNGALWSIGLRTKAATKHEVEKAIADRKIVRTWPMRGTLHFVHAEDVHWLVNLLAPRATASVKNRRVQQLGLTDAVVAEAEKVLRSELKGGKYVLRSDVVKLLSQKVKGLTITNQHTQHLMRNFGERGIICFGSHVGKQPTFVLLDEWAPKKHEKTRSEALAELAKRYFISHGPATVKDFAGWCFMTITEARTAIELAKDELQELIDERTTYYQAPELKTLTTSTYLLPGFDEYILGYKDRSAVLSAVHANKIVPGNNGMFLPTIVQKGQVIGTWKRLPKKALELQSYPFYKGKLNLGPATEKYRHFLETV